MTQTYDLYGSTEFVEVAKNRQTKLYIDWIMVSAEMSTNRVVHDLVQITD